MRIISCNIANFGKLHDLKLSFAEGLNKIEERNGWGKSTLSSFVKAMLYGLEGDGKRDETVCERKRFKPWQGGTFGGSLTFETGDKRYEVFRSFGNKPADDVFELRNADTNLVSTDFTEKLGEELFKINAESFARTVFIKQSDAGFTDATADINAKLGNISDHLDLNRFDTIETRIKDELNALSATRKTGEIYRLKDSVTELKARILADSDAESGAESIRVRIEDSKKKLEDLSSEKAKLTGLRKEASLMLQKKADRETYDNLVNDLKQKEASLSEAKESLSFRGLGEVSDTVNLIMSKSSELSSLHKRIAENANKRLYTISSINRETETKENAVSDLSFERDDCLLNVRKNQVSLIVKLILLCFVLMAGGCVIYLNDMVGLVSLTVGLSVFVVLLLVIIISFFIKRKNLLRHIDMLDSRILKLKEEIEALDVEKENLGAETEKDDCSGLIAEIQGLFLDFGLSVGETEFSGALSGIMRKSEAVTSRNELYTDALNRMAEFEKNHDIAELLKDRSGDIPDLEEIDGRERALDLEIKTINDNLSIDKRQLEAFLERIENIDDLEERLENVTEAIAEKSERVELLESARDYLVKAKENLAMRYIGPLRDSFSKYYKLITGKDATDYTLDANLNLSVSDGSLLHSTGFLSDGYRDLTGICMRLALADAMYQGEKPVLIMDDPFVNLDEENHAGAYKLLEEVANCYQIIYFTCR